MKVANSKSILHVLMSKRMLLGAAAATMSSVSLAQSVSADSAFRDIFGVDPSSLASIMAGNNGTLIGAVSNVINIVALTAAVFAMILTFFVGLAQSAHDGSVLGKRYSSLWVPLRSVIGLGFLTPLPGGYSMLQAFVLWIGTLGSMFADQAWTGSLSYMSQGNAPATIMSTPNSRATVTAMFNASVCAARAQAVAREAGDGSFGVEVIKVGRAISRAGAPAYYESQGDLAGVGTAAFVVRGGVRFDGQGAMYGAKAVCGEVMVEHTMPPGGALSGAIFATANEQVANLHAMSDDTMRVATDMVAGGVLSGTDVRRQLLAIESAYAIAESERIRRYGTAASGALQEARELTIQRAGNGGWITAGAWYNTLAGASNAVQEGAQTETITRGARLDQMPASLRDDIKPFVDSAETITRATSGTGQVDTAAAEAGVSPAGAGDTSEPGWWDSVTSSLSPSALWNSAFNNATGIVSTWCRGIFESLVHVMIGDPGDDPIIKLQQFGHAGLNTLEVVLSGMFLIAVTLGALVVGLGASIGIFMMMVPTIIGLGLPLVILAYYLPMIPFIYWTFGTLAWVLLLLEGVAIAPMWAAAHVWPEGEGLAGERAKQGWVLMLSLLLRPVLMVFGFVAAILVVRFMSLVLGTTFRLFMDASMGSQTFGIISTAAYLIALVALVIAVSKQAFALIYLVPDRALRFIGAGDSLGEAGSISNVREAAGPIVAMGAAGAGAVMSAAKSASAVGQGAKSAAGAVVSKGK